MEIEETTAPPEETKETDDDFGIGVDIGGTHVTSCLVSLKTGEV